MLLDPYAARSCALKTFHRFHPGSGRPAVVPPGRPGFQEFRQQVRSSLLAGGALDLLARADLSAEDQRELCRQAMEQGVPQILGGLLPLQPGEPRTGRAELLIRHRDGYLPGILSFARQLDVRRDGHTQRLSPLHRVDEPEDVDGWRFRWSRRWRPLLHLAHLYRMLDQAGFAGEPTGLVIGTDGVGEDGAAVWIDLTEPSVPDPVCGPPLCSAIDSYDANLAERVRLAGVAAASPIRTPAEIRPVVTAECGWCGWWQQCQSLLDPDDISLQLPRSFDATEVQSLRSLGVDTVADLATVEVESLLDSYLPLVGHRPDADDRLRLGQRRAQLIDADIALERITTGPIEVPAAEVEIDIDIETSADDRVYLWGFWIQDGDAQGYHHISRFSELTPQAELDLAIEAMRWLRDRIAGRVVKIYHYSSYEPQRLRLLAARSDDPVFAWALDQIQSSFVDLFTLVRSHYFGTWGLGLKMVASRAAGFSWRDAEPGGLNSLSWFADAVAAPTVSQRESARLRLLAYNEDDVKATVAVRSWLRAQ